MSLDEQAIQDMEQFNIRYTIDCPRRENKKFPRASDKRETARDTGTELHKIAVYGTHVNSRNHPKEIKLHFRQLVKLPNGTKKMLDRYGYIPATKIKAFKEDIESD